MAPDGDPDADVTVEGHVLRASVDDGSLRGLLLAADDDAVHAFDADSGAERWSSDVMTNASSALIMRGRVFVSNGSRIVALDGGDGQQLWSAEVGQGILEPSLLTDGRHLLLSLEDVLADDANQLIAYDPASGREAFRAALPAGVSAVGTAQRSLVGLDRTAGEYVVLD